MVRQRMAEAHPMTGDIPSYIDPLHIGASQAEAIICDRVNLGLTNAQVSAKYGERMIGTPYAVGRIRRNAGFDNRGAPMHARHQLDDEAYLDEIEIEDEEARFNEIDRLMRGYPGNRNGARATTGTHAFTSKPHSKPEVYFVEGGEGEQRLIKIGYSNDTRTRLGELQVGSPVELRLLGTIAGSRATEAQLHTIFAADRVRGEWFRPSSDLIAVIEGRAFIAPNGKLRFRRAVTEL